LASKFHQNLNYFLVTLKLPTARWVNLSVEKHNRYSSGGKFSPFSIKAFCPGALSLSSGLALAQRHVSTSGDLGYHIELYLILGYLAADNSLHQIIQEFPYLSKEQIALCLDYAQDLPEFEIVTC
jgi:hypothetical protein